MWVFFIINISFWKNPTWTSDRVEKTQEVWWCNHPILSVLLKIYISTIYNQEILLYKNRELSFLIFFNFLIHFVAYSSHEPL